MRIEDTVFRLIGSGEVGARPPIPLPEAIIHRMKEAAGRHQRSKCPFAIGSLVMARKGGVMADADVGLPAMVIATKTPEYDWSTAGSMGSPSYGMQIDMRVLTYDRTSDHIIPLWVDSADYEQYVAEETKEAADVA